VRACRAGRIEVGYGLEELITDGFAGETIRRAILPAFRRNDYNGGVLAGATRLVQRVAERRGVTLTEVPAEPVPSRESGPPAVAIIFMIVVLLAMASLRRRQRRRTWPLAPWFIGPFGRGGWHGGLGGFGRGFGGGFGGRRGGGGFGGFGGGMSGGGGASGRW
jgi:uncharacterized protein